jgi:PAS domain S-box-containing protein
MNKGILRIRESQQAWTCFFVLIALLTLPHRAWATPDDQSRGLDKIIAAIPLDAPPTYYRDPSTGEPAGFAVDLANEVSRRAGYSLSYVFLNNWEEIEGSIQRGDTDLVPGLSISADRKSLYSFSEPFDIFTISFFVRAGSVGPELKHGAVVGVIKGSVAYELLRPRTDIRLAQYDHFETGLFDLLAGKIDSFACPTPVLWRLAMDARVEDQITVMGKPVAEVKRAFGVKKGRTELAARLNKALEGFVGSSEYQKIYSKWYGKPKPYFTLSKQTIGIVIVLSLVVVATAAWRHLSVMSLTSRLRREIEERKKTEGALKDSEESYRVLFDQDPLPGWIYDTETFGFLLVNNAAQNNYGYTREEFYSMTIKDIRPAEDVDKLLNFSAKLSDKPAVSGFWNHRKKDGGLIHVEINSHPMMFNGKKARRVIVKDITERRKSEEALRTSEVRLREITDNMVDMVARFDERAFYLYVSPSYEKVLGYRSEELIGTWAPDLLHPDDRDADIQAIDSMLRSDSDKVEFRFRHKDGSYRWIESTGRNLINAQGNPIGSVMGSRDITERKKAEEMLRRSEHQLAESQQVAKIGSWSWDIVNNTLDWSQETFRRFDKDPKTFTPTVEYYVGLIHPDDRAVIQKAIQESIENDAPYRIQPRIRNENGREWVLEGFGVVERDGNGKPIRFAGTAQDITERKRADELILRSLKEKEVLLKEIHHRVKNNMQVIYSLLNLQAKGIADKTVRAMFEDARNRVNSMALIHERLYQSKDLAHINFKEYLQNLMQSIADTYKRHDVVLSVDMEPVALDVNIGIPCGLIVNELVSNSLKYAFPEGKKGTIKVGIKRNPEGNHVLFVTDNGVGFPDAVDFRNTPSLGLQLVGVLTGQIHGTIELSKTEGTAFSITFAGNNL